VNDQYTGTLISDLVEASRRIADLADQIRATAEAIRIRIEDFEDDMERDRR
jgi:hypothetical protein